MSFSWGRQSNIKEPAISYGRSQETSHTSDFPWYSQVLRTRNYKPPIGIKSKAVAPGRNLNETAGSTEAKSWSRTQQSVHSGEALHERTQSLKPPAVPSSRVLGVWPPTNFVGVTTSNEELHDRGMADVVRNSIDLQGKHVYNLSSPYRSVASSVWTHNDWQNGANPIQLPVIRKAKPVKASTGLPFTATTTYQLQHADPRQLRPLPTDHILDQPRSLSVDPMMMTTYKLDRQARVPMSAADVDQALQQVLADRPPHTRSNIDKFSTTYALQCDGI